MIERRIRILTANLFNGRAAPGPLADLLHSLQVDVAALQEVDAEQAAAVAQVLPHGKIEPNRSFTGMGIALARPAQVRRLPLPRRDAWVAELSAAEWGPHAPLEILNLHIHAPHIPPPWRSFAVRRGQIAGVAAYLDSVPCSRRVLVGDLNATPLWPAYRRLVRHLTDEVLGHAERVGRPVRPTWGPWPGAPRLLRIDHVMGNGVTAVQVEPIRIVGSDHDALLVDLVASENEEL